MKTLQPAIFLDRDGTIIEDRGYLSHIEDIKFFPGIIKPLREISKRFLLFIITNQDGVSKGVITAADVERVNSHILDYLAAQGITITDVFVCPHTKEEKCLCRKPSTRFIYQAAVKYNIDLANSFIIGDHPSDVLAGQNYSSRGIYGFTGIYLLSGHGEKHVRELPRASYVAPHLVGAMDIVNQLGQKSSTAVDDAARKIQLGGVGIFPTETVYGIGANAFDASACEKIFAIKQRPHSNPLIVHIADYAMLEKICKNLNDKASSLMHRFWPGPLTLILPKAAILPGVVTAGLETVAVRMPAHPVAINLIKKSACPIAAPSANPFGLLSPTSPGHLAQRLRERVDFILDGGQSEVGLESTIIKLTDDNPVLLRAGGIPLEEIEKIIGSVTIGRGSKDHKYESPGQFPKHYSPVTPLKVISDLSEIPLKTKNFGLLSASPLQTDVACKSLEILSSTGDLREAAANLFSALHRLDSCGLDIIYALRVPEIGYGRAIMDRLYKAQGDQSE